MAMGIVSDEELEKELNNGNTRIPVNGIVIPKENDHGRNNGDVNVPESLRKVIGQDSIENGRSSALALASSFGISDSSVSAYANGATSTAQYNGGNRELRKHNNKVKERIVSKARSRLISSLNHITPEKLQEAKLKDVSAVARDMSMIIKNMEPQDVENEDNKPNVNIIFYAPNTRKESEYDVIDVNE